MTSRNERSSALMVSLPFGRVYPNPDGSIDNEGDRQHNADLYAFAETGGEAVVMRPFMTNLGVLYSLRRMG